MSDIRPKISEKIDQLIHEIVEMDHFIKSIDCKAPENKGNIGIFYITESNCLLLQKISLPDYATQRACYLLNDKDYQTFIHLMKWHHENNCNDGCDNEE